MRGAEKYRCTKSAGACSVGQPHATAHTVPTPFSRTTRALNQSTATTAVFIWCGAAVLLAAWGAWFFMGQLDLVEASEQARLEVQQAAHALSAQLPGRVLATRLQLGQQVAAGDVLVELDAATDTLRLSEERARLKALGEQMAALRQEITTRQQTAAPDGPDTQAAQAALQAAQARTREASAALAFATDNERRLREESKAGSVAAVEALLAQSEMNKLTAASDALAAEARRLQASANTRASEQRAQVEALQRTLAALGGEQAAAAQSAQRLLLDIERHRVRAPVAGRVGDMAALRVGDVVGAGQKFASIVPSGELMAVAEFEPRAVLGRVRAGQHAELRLAGFPWAQFGTLPATVSRVATELRDGRIRVEFAPQGNWAQRSAAAGIALQHGLPGAVEVTVDRVSPAVLVLRASGQLLAGSTPPANAADKR